MSHVRPMSHAPRELPLSAPAIYDDMQPPPGTTHDDSAVGTALEDLVEQRDGPDKCQICGFIGLHDYGCEGVEDDAEADSHGEEDR